MDVLISRDHQPRIDLQPLGQATGEALGIPGGCVISVVIGGKQSRIAPNLLAVGPPMTVQRPPRKLLARILLAHAVIDHRTLRQPSISRRIRRPA